MVAAKHPSVRARTNRTAVNAVLRRVKNPKVPALPDHTDWSVAVQDWWRRAWSSPMSEEWVESDVDAMYMAASLMEQFWDPYTSSDVRLRATVQVLKILGECGLTPLARRRLQWQVEQGEEASEKTTARRAARKSKVVGVVVDPREGRRGVHV